MTLWSHNAIFYHIYPLGLCGAPERNDFSSPPVHRLGMLYPWLDHIASMGCNALYIGPLFESGSHGYDTADYYHPDRRLGDRASLAQFCEAARSRGLRIVFDAVFNHVGRNFWAFRELLALRQSSPCREWFSGLRFDRSNRFGDPFSYDTWAGHESLVKLNLAHPAVREHLFGAVEHWMRDYGIDGLRLDAADVMDFGFLRDLSACCRRLKPDFWLMGEVVHGDYRRWANPQTLDSVTNYECFKGLSSSLNERNLFEIAYAANRQWGQEGLYCGLPIYNFVDNHDVSRAASLLREPRHLAVLYGMLFTIPGVPSIYYGSEFGIQGMKGRFSDAPLRPKLDLAQLSVHPNPLMNKIRRLIQVRRALPALQMGSYRQLMVSSEQWAFLRQDEGQPVLVAVNAADHPLDLSLTVPEDGEFEDRLQAGERFSTTNRTLRLPLPAFSTRICAFRGLGQK